ncbi:hypothetical protein [Thiolapillus sp.]
MKNSTILLLCSILLIILGIVMVALGLKAGILPPTVTGIGFFVTAVALMAAGKK